MSPGSAVPWLHLQRGILEDFAELHHLVERRETENHNAGGLEARRRAWRARQQERGSCSSCRRPAVTSDGRWPLCAIHLEANRERARASWAKRQEAKR